MRLIIINQCKLPYTVESYCELDFTLIIKNQIYYNRASVLNMHPSARIYHNWLVSHQLTIIYFGSRYMSRFRHMCVEVWFWWYHLLSNIIPNNKVNITVCCISLSLSRSHDWIIIKAWLFWDGHFQLWIFFDVRRNLKDQVIKVISIHY